jgi:RES domain-containing protein
MKLWRISDYADLTGTGGLLADGRWHSMGHTIVYTSESSAGALNELLVHMNRQFIAPDFQLLRIDVPDNVEISNHQKLSTDWRNDLSETRKLGNQWLSERKSLLLRVPSAIIPHSFNVLINPKHTDVGKLKIDDIQNVQFDPRLR